MRSSQEGFSGSFEGKGAGRRRGFEGRLRRGRRDSKGGEEGSKRSNKGLKGLRSPLRDTLRRVEGCPKPPVRDTPSSG